MCAAPMRMKGAVRKNRLCRLQLVMQIGCVPAGSRLALPVAEKLLFFCTPHGEPLLSAFVESRFMDRIKCFFLLVVDLVAQFGITAWQTPFE